MVPFMVHDCGSQLESLPIVITELGFSFEVPFEVPQGSLHGTCCDPLLGYPNPSWNLIWDILGSAGTFGIATTC